MNIEEFISESLNQIINGIRKVQVELKGTGAKINPQMRITSKEHSTGQAEGHGSQPVIYVSYDISVTATKGGIGVVSAGLGLDSQGQSEERSGNESRIQFQVPVLFPTQKE